MYSGIRRQKRACTRVLKWHRSSQGKRHMDIEFNPEIGAEKLELPPQLSQEIRFEATEDPIKKERTWNEIRAFRETREAIFEPVKLVAKDSDTVKLAEALLSGRFCSTNVFDKDRVNNVAERIEYSQKSHAIYGLSPGDIHCTEILEATPVEELPIARRQKKKASAGFICCTISSQCCTTAALLTTLSVELKVPLQDLRCFAFTESPTFSVTQKVFVLVSDQERKYVLHRLEQLKQEISEVPSSVSLTNVSVHSTLAKPGNHEIPARYAITNTSLNPSEGSFVILDFEEEKIAHSPNQIVDDISHYYSMNQFKWNVVLRDVKADEQTIDNVVSLKEMGGLNLLPTAYCNSNDGRGWIRVGVEVCKGNFRQACSKTLKVLSQIDPKFNRALKHVEVLSSKAKTQTPPWYNEVDDTEGALETPPIVNESDLEANLQELDVSLEWGGDLLFATLADLRMDPYQGSYQNIPPLIRSRIENSLRNHIWNTMACERLSRYGPYPVPGDIIVNNLGRHQIIKSQEECNLYSPLQVVLPRPALYSGHDWQKGLIFPEHDISQAAYEILMKKMGLSPNRLFKSQPKPPHESCYRKVFAKPTKFEFDISSGSVCSKMPVGGLSELAMKKGNPLDGGDCPPPPPTLYSDVWSCSDCGL
eukprot:TRINITY_DN1538_c0_g1_i2.p1 TRINITY_DN1538_c0_g1~~TRINITY_DN1538_c0_g1_i2.p1  ORF type:complete len:647 (+),score=110.48 TRINITY_DN1538_c0_g1_i2:69-2009(+)